MTVLFLADIPDQVRLLTLYGKLKMGFRNSSGQEVTFDVLDEPTPSGTSTAPTVELGGGVTNGGSIDAAQINAGTSRYLDLIYKAAPGATIDYTRILSGSVVFTVTVGGTPTTAGATTRVHTAKPTPVVLITTAFGTAVAAELVVDATTDAADHRISYSYRVDPDVLTPAGLTTVVVLKRSDLTSTSMTDAQLMEAAVRKLGITRFRYQFGTDVTGPPATFTPDNSDLALGVVHVVFGADQFKNQDLVTGPTTTTGAFNAPTDLSFTILGATASVTDPSWVARSTSTPSTPAAGSTSPSRPRPATRSTSPRSSTSGPSSPSAVPASAPPRSTRPRRPPASTATRRAPRRPSRRAPARSAATAPGTSGSGPPASSAPAPSP